MPFPRKLLNEGEEPIVDIRPHWWFLAGPTLALLGAVILGLIVINKVPESHGWEWDIGSTGTALIVLGCVFWFAARYARWASTNFVVTTDRVVYRHGVIAKHGIEIPLERVNTVFFNQTVFERLIGAGDLSIESGGETGKETFSNIRKPSFVQNEIYRQMEANENRKYDRINANVDAKTRAPSQAGIDPHSVPEQIDRLDDLRRRGIISEEEFAAKKAELLDRM